MSVRISLVLGVFVWMLACEPEGIVGDDRADAGPGEDAGELHVPPDAGPPLALECRAAVAEPVDADFDGWTEAPLPSGADRVRIKLPGEGGHDDGFVVLGEAPPFVPDLTDRRRCDFALCQYSELDLYNPASALAYPELQEGFRYTLRDLVVEERRIGFSIAPFEPFDQWCALQTPHPKGAGEFWCTPNLGSTGLAPAPGGTLGHCFQRGDGGLRAIGCCQLALCELGAGCQCDATSCWANTAHTREVSLTVVDDVAFDGEWRLVRVDSADD